MERIKVAVVGIGKLGRHHARIYSELKNVDLVGIVDIDKKKAQRLAKEYKTNQYYDYRELLGRIDAVNIVVPTEYHYNIARDFLISGCNVFIEKPITPTLPEAEGLLKIASQKNLILQVGHIERFNVAVQEAQKYIKSPQYIEAYRLGPFDPRTTGVGVVLDLMIHDIDIVLSLVKSPIKYIDAIGMPILTNHEDLATAHINFENGCIANITASRVTKDKLRKIRVFQNNIYISLDYWSQSLKVLQKKEGVKTIKSMRDIVIRRPSLKRGEPLKGELQDFIDCVQAGKKPLVPGEHGRDALEVALEVLNKIRERRELSKTK